MVIQMKIKGLYIIGLILILTGCSNQNDELQHVKLMLDYTPNTNHTGIYVAKELGYYEDLGIDLEIIQPSDISTEAAVASSSADFGISYGENVAMFNNDEDRLKSIYAILDTNTSGFISKTSSEINRPKDFEGKTYCGWGSAIETSLVKTLVEKDGGDSSKVNIVTSPANLESENSDCDLIWAYAGWDKIDLENKGIDINYIPFSDYGVDWYTPVIIANNDYIEKNNDLISKFIKATQKGYKYAKNNPDKSADILVKQVPELDPELVAPSELFLAEHFENKDGGFGYQSPKMWEDFTNWLIENEIITEKDSSKFYTNDFIK